MKIHVYERNVWGKVKIYIRNAEHQKYFTILSGQRTIKPEQIDAMKFFGLDFEIDRLPENIK